MSDQQQNPLTPADAKAKAKADKAYAKAMRPWYKKKRTWIILAIALIIIIAIVGSQSKHDDGSVPAANASNAQTAAGAGASADNSVKAAQVHQIGEAVKINSVTQTVTAAKKVTSKDQYAKPADGKVYYAVDVTIKNDGTEPASFNALDYKIEDANGVQTSTSWMGGSVGITNELHSGSLAPGGTVSGTLLFEVPSDMKSLKLITEPNLWTRQQIKVALN